MNTEDKKSQGNILGTEAVGTLLAKFSIPGIAALVVNALYNIVDQIFIGQGVGYLGNGATNVIFPLSTFAMAFALMIGDGAASYMSLMLGKKQERKAAQGTAAGMLGIVAAGIIIAALYLAFLTPLCRLFGATDAILPYALQYGGITAIGIPFCAVCAGYASIIRADGSPKYNMLGLLVGCVLNLILDPVFIFICGWGVAGAAFATIIGQIANAAINFAYIPRMKSVRITREDIKQCGKSLSAVLKLGVSSFISQMVLVVVMAVQNNILRDYGAASKYGADIPISALGVTMKVFNILLVIIIGLASGAQPIWGYNYGARLYKRVQKTFALVIIISSAVMLFAFAIFQLFPLVIISIFGSEDDLYNEFAIKTLRIFLLLVPVGGVQLASGIFFQAVGRPVQASLISLSKQIIFMIPALLILSPLLGVEGVLWAGPASDALAFLMTLILLKLSWKSIFASEPEAAQPPVSAQMSSPAPREGATGLAKEKYLIYGKSVVITIDRNYGAGGRTLGRKLAEQFDIPYYDSDIIKEAADESGLNAMFLAFIDEKPRHIRGMTNAAPSYSADSSAFSEVQRAAEQAQSAVIEKLAANGSCVIVGRRADQVLAGKAAVFRIFVAMPLEKRIEKIRRSENVSRGQAERRIKATDKAREDYYNLSGGGKWGSAENYDLCLDAGAFSQDEMVKVIMLALREYQAEELRA